MYCNKMYYKIKFAIHCTLECACCARGCSLHSIAIHFHCIIHIAIYFNCIPLYCSTFWLYSVFIAIGNVMLIIKSRDNIFMTQKDVTVITIKTFYSQEPLLMSKLEISDNIVVTSFSSNIKRGLGPISPRMTRKFKTMILYDLTLLVSDLLLVT